MWNYNYTDTMYISNDINNKNATIIHSDIYLGKDFSDGISHFKYIKREMVNGKWKYYYKNDRLDYLKRQKNRAIDDYNAMERAYDTSIKNFKKGDRNIDIVLANRSYANKLHRESSEKFKKYNTEKQKDDKRRIKYEKYLIKPLNKASDAISKGKTRLSNLFNKIKSKIKRR